MSKLEILQLVQQTLQGMPTRHADEGVRAMGRHAATIRLGRHIWQSAPLEADVARLIKERFFDDGSSLAIKEGKAAVVSMKNPVEERPVPFQGQALPSAFLTVVDYGHRISAWMEQVQPDEEAPTCEQLAILNRVAQRVLDNFASNPKACH